MKKITVLFTTVFLATSASYSAAFSFFGFNKSSIQVPSDITVTASYGENWASVLFDATGTNFYGKVTDVTCSPDSGSKFNVGTTTVICRTGGRWYQRKYDSFTVTVVEQEPEKHVIQLPEDITVAATSSNGAIVTFDAFGTSSIGGKVAAFCAPESGSAFSVGSTQVNCSTEGSSITRDSGSFTVTVKDDEAPSLSVPETISITSSDGREVAVSYNVTAIDKISGEVNAQCLPASGSYFSVGSHTVSCSASDSSGNAGEQSFTVVVAQEEVVEVPEEPETDPETGQEEELFSVTLNWTAPSTRANGTSLPLSEIAQYEIYVIGELTGIDQTFVVDGGSVDQYTIENLQGDRYHFAISTIDSGGLHSAPSELVAVELGDQLQTVASR